MGKLYEECSLCTPIEAGVFKVPVCPGCRGRGFVEIGLTSDQVGRITRDNERLNARQMAERPLAAVVEIAASNTVLHLCDLPSTAICVSQALTREGRTNHAVHAVEAVRYHAAGKGDVT